MMPDEYSASLKLWDIRNTSKPVWGWKNAGLVNLNPQCNVALSSNERVVLTGSSVRKGLGHYALLMGFDTLTG
jgi:hypothetical protein